MPLIKIDDQEIKVSGLTREQILASSQSIRIYNKDDIFNENLLENWDERGDEFKSEIEARRWMELLLYAGELVTLRKEGEKIFND